METIRVCSDEKTLSELYNQGKRRIGILKGKQDMFSLHKQKREEKQVTGFLLSNIKNILLNGTQLILNEVFKLIGFDAIAKWMSFFLMFCISLALLPILMFDFFAKVFFFLLTAFHNFQN